MVTNSDDIHLSLSQRFFEYAQAYLNSATTLCLTMTSDDTSCTWPNATVVMLLAAHATELFLKGAILSRDATAKIEHHSIEKLSDEFRKFFPESSFELDIPFKTDWMDMTETKITEIKNTMPKPSVFYRYPVANDRKEWKGAFSFEPNSFIKALKRFKDDFERIKAQID